MAFHVTFQGVQTKSRCVQEFGRVSRMPNKLVPPPRLEQYRAALLPAAQGVEPVACRAELLAGGPSFLNLLLSNDLAPLWHHCLQSAGLLESLPGETVEALRSARMVAAAAYLRQTAALAHLDALFTAQGIGYLVMKGVFVRECVHPDPALRPAGDIDILISPNDRRRAASALLDSGYAVNALPENLSHEATFSRGQVDIDLHWHILRPGHTRSDMTDCLLARRQQVHGVWGLSDGDALFVMLTHPAFAKYVCSPNMGLGRVADFLLWMQRRMVDWPAVLQMLDAQGLKTAAWTTLTWFQMLAQSEAARAMDEWLATLRPGYRRAGFLRAWLTHDLPSRWLERPLLIQLGFILPLHDRPADALRALRAVWQARQNRLRDRQLLLGDEH